MASEQMTSVTGHKIEAKKEIVIIKPGASDWIISD